ATPALRRDAATAYARGSDDLRLSAELPDAWRDIVRACLTRTHEERVDGGELLRRVREAAAGPARGPRLPRPRRTARPRPTRRRTRRAVTAAAALATATVVALGYGLGVRAGDPPGADGRATAGGTGVAAATYGADELRTDRGVPPAYRLLIVQTARGGARPGPVGAPRLRPRRPRRGPARRRRRGHGRRHRRRRRHVRGGRAAHRPGRAARVPAADRADGPRLRAARCHRGADRGHA